MKYLIHILIFLLLAGPVDGQDIVTLSYLTSYIIEPNSNAPMINRPRTKKRPGSLLLTIFKRPVYFKYDKHITYKNLSCYDNLYYRLAVKEHFSKYDTISTQVSTADYHYGLSYDMEPGSKGKHPALWERVACLTEAMPVRAVIDFPPCGEGKRTALLTADASKWDAMPPEAEMHLYMTALTVAVWDVVIEKDNVKYSFIEIKITDSSGNVIHQLKTDTQKEMQKIYNDLKAIHIQKLELK